MVPWIGARLLWLTSLLAAVTFPQVRGSADHCAENLISRRVSLLELDVR